MYLSSWLSREWLRMYRSVELIESGWWIAVASLWFPIYNRAPFGSNVTDIDECAQQGGQFGNHCHLNTVCENTIGSYVCNCLPGFRRVDKFNCAEINECAANLHSCHENAECINTIGSYTCRCKDGYEGDGIQCKRKYFTSFLFQNSFSSNRFCVFSPGSKRCASKCVWMVVSALHQIRVLAVWVTLVPPANEI